MRSAKQARFLAAAEHSPAFAQKVGFNSGARQPITLPGGAVQSGGYLENTKFKTPSMPMRKVRV